MSASEEMTLLSLVPQHVRDLVLDAENVREPPWADVSEFGLTAIIDISGYSKLTSLLKEFYGNDGGAKVKELLNPPIIEIIKRVQNRFGSVVKFSGDAIIASWSSKGSLSRDEKEYTAIKALLCCVELLSFFSDYTVKVPCKLKDVNPASDGPISTINQSHRPSMVGQKGGGLRYSVSVHPAMKRASMSPTENVGIDSGPLAFNNVTPTVSVARRRTSGQFAALHLPNRGSIVDRVMPSSPLPPRRASGDKNSLPNDGSTDVVWKPHSLKIHIGLGFGKTSHIHIGNSYNVEFGADSRVEYFVAGESMKNAAEYLGVGSEGDLVFSPEIVSLLSPKLQEDVHKYSELRMSQGLKYRIVTSSLDEVFEMVIPLVDRIGKIDMTLNTNTMALARSRSNIALQRIHEISAMAKAVSFMDDAIKRLLQNALGERVKPSAVDWASVGRPSVVMNVQNAFDNYDQLRNVSVLFLKMPTFVPETLHEPRNLAILQDVMEIVLTSIRKFEGCLRQFNCDDKGVTALLVWGLDGFSHEKGESPLAVGAALNMLSPLKRQFGNNFSIGISTGSVFSGIVGNSKRCDGTVLGVSVNNAARFMCLPQCEGGIICDVETYNGSKGMYVYKSDLSPVIIKGVAEPINIFMPSKKSRLGSVKITDDDVALVGRGLEKSRIQSIIESWKMQNCETLLISGRSGVGKSQIRRYCEKLLIGDRSILLCASQSLEHQQKAPLFIFGDILRELSHLLKHKIDYKEIAPSGSHRTSRLSYSVGSRSKEAVFKAGEPDRRKSVALSILESVEASSRRPSFTVPMLFGSPDEMSPATSFVHHTNRVDSGENSTSRRGSMFDSVKMIMNRRSTYDVGRTSAPKILEDSLPRSRTETHSRKSSFLPPAYNAPSISIVSETPVGGEKHSKKRNVPSIGSGNSNHKFLDTPTSQLASKSIESNLISTRSTFVDHGAVVAFLQHLGEPQSSIDLLKFIPGILDVPDSSQISSDLIPRLTGIFAKIFANLELAGFRIAFIFDDLQWCDSSSYDLLTSLLKHCPEVLCIMLCRPVEEWNKIHQERYNALASLSSHNIPLFPFREDGIEELIRYKFRSALQGSDSISPRLVNDVLERSQGIALVAVIFINMLLEESLLKVEDGTLTYVDEASSIQLPNEAVGAVVSQFDKLPKPVKSILRLAAVSGQHFDLTELCSIISTTDLKEKLLSVDISPISLSNLLISADKYRFLTKGETQNSLAFSHYLIQQGILSTVIPTKREEMHAMFTNFYEDKLASETVERKPYLTQILIYHLLRLNGQEARKHAIVFQAFVESASMFRSTEALEYFEIMQNLRKGSKIQQTLMEKVKEARMLGQLSAFLGERQVAFKHFYNALVTLGYSLPTTKIYQVVEFLQLVQKIRHFLRCNVQEQTVLSTALLNKKFPKATKAVKTNEISNAGLTIPETIFEEISLSISGIVRLLSLNKNAIAWHIFSALSTAIMGCDESDRTLRYCINYLRLSKAIAPMGFRRLSSTLALHSGHLYLKVLEEYRIENMTSAQTDIYAELVLAKAVDARKQGHWKEALEQYKEFESISIAIGLGASEDAFRSRSKIAEMLILLGDFSGAEYDKEHNLKWYTTNNCDMYVIASYLIQQAVIQCCLGNSDDASRVYLHNAHIKSSPTALGNMNIDQESERNLAFEACCLWISTCMMHYAKQKEDVHVWKCRAEIHCTTILDSLEALSKTNLQNQAAVLWLCVSCIADWYIFDDGLEKISTDKYFVASPDSELLKFIVNTRDKEAIGVFGYLSNFSKTLTLLRKGLRAQFCKGIDILVESAVNKPYLAEFHKILLLTYRWMVYEPPQTNSLNGTAAHAYISYFESMEYKFRCDIIERRMLKKLHSSLPTTSK